MKQKIKIIVAKNTSDYIGKGNDMLYHIKADLKRFKRLTIDQVVVMGRKTYESIGHALPYRINVVITNDNEWKPKEHKTVVCHTISDVDSIAKQYPNKTIYIIGGGEIYQQYMDIADEILLTEIDDNTMGDVVFPSMYVCDWRMTSFKRGNDKESKYNYNFIKYVRN